MKELQTQVMDILNRLKEIIEASISMHITFLSQAWEESMAIPRCGLPSPLIFTNSSPLEASEFTFFSALVSFFLDSTAIIEKRKAKFDFP
jgi:hypothetical protein